MKSGGKKVRTGCRTCKIRRVKCDEQKPYCNRCRSTGRKCDGYQFESRAVATRLAHDVAVELPGTRRERKAFEFFCSCTSASICNYFPDKFWEHNVLQASFSQPCLRHAAVAVGSLHEGFARNLMDGGPRDVRSNLFALRQYSKAITHLSGSLSKNKHYSTVALMCCILFVAFDSLLDEPDLAVAHLRSGLDILRNLDSSEIIYFHDIFARMTIMSIIYMDPKPTARPLDAWELPSPHLHSPPAKFATLFEARICLNSIHESMFRSFSTDHTGLKGTSNGASGYHPMASGVQGPRAMPPSLSTADFKSKYVTALQRWSHAFESFLRDPNLSQDGENLRGALLLKVHQSMSLIMVLTDLSKSRPSYEPFAAGFETIVNLGEALIKTEVQSHRLLCSPALGILGPLCYAAKNSPDEHIHRRAMDLLAIPRREGMFDNRKAVDLATRNRSFRRRNSGASIGSGDLTSRASLSPRGSEEYYPGEHLNDESKGDCLVTADDWDTAIWDVFPALAAIRPRACVPVYSNEIIPVWGFMWL